jgi:CRISPR-associated endoribonuclease Cas6
VADRPEFGILFGRLRDRISTLRALYGPGPLEIDFRGMGERAAQVRMTRCELQRSEVDRLSSRTGQRHPLGGFVGEAQYEGELGEFLPYLRAGKWTGVGRQTVWGKGEIEVVSS